MARIRLVTATPSLLEAFLVSPSALASALGSDIPDGWPHFPEAIPNTLAILTDRPDEAEWWMSFFLDDTSGALVGSGGFAGPPVDGCVEIGYEIAPAHRRQGLATAAVRALLERAVDSGSVRRVIAHTLSADERSAGVLLAAGFAAGDSLEDPDAGAVTRWERSVAVG